MEKTQLPNSTLILVLGILSVIGCCCGGFLGVILGIVTIIMANKAMQIYYADPHLYTGVENVKTGRVLAIIGLVLSGITLIYFIAQVIIFGSFEGAYEIQQEIMREYGG